MSTFTNLVPLKPEDLLLPLDGRILFCRRDRVSFGFLSNFQPAVIELDGHQWPTVEHYYQAQKSFDPAYQAAIRGATTPGKAKRLGTLPTLPRAVSRQSWFRRYGQLPRADWMEARLDVMRRALIAKFSQNVALKSLLAATGSAELIEDSSADDYWGIGAEGRGQNWLGRLLMEVRVSCSEPGRSAGNR